MNDKELCVNIFPLINQTFDFQVYRMPWNGSLKIESFPFTVKKYPLIDPQTKEKMYFLFSFDHIKGFKLNKQPSLDSINLTKWYLVHLLKEKCIACKINYSDESKFLKLIEIIINESSVGQEAISIMPAYHNKTFGFIIDYHFIKDKNIAFSRDVQIKSLSLDAMGRPNKDYYLDKYNKIKMFISAFWDKLFLPLEQENSISVSKEMLPFGKGRLSAKTYIFGNSQSDNSQFKGILNHGPYLPYTDNYKLCFVFRNNEKQLSHELYYALNGSKYPTFAGMDKMFHFPMNHDTVMGIGVNSYDEKEILQLIDKIKAEAKGRPVLPVVLVPWTRDSATEKESYTHYLMKYHFLKNNMPSQFTGINKVINYETLKWSVSSMGLQIFTKIGGSPWCLNAKTKNCLIIGIGQSHKKSENYNIEKYFSYSIMSDSSGLFKKIKILADNSEKDKYLNGLYSKLKEIITEEIGNYENFIVHTSFRLRNEENDVIRKAISELSVETTQKKFAVIRFDDSHNYMGYDFNFNSLTPYESTYTRLSYKEYLVWFEGLSSSTNTLKTRIGPPMRVFIDYPEKPDTQDTINYLQDAVNLSGANWRGFNARTTPISVLYAHLLSTFVSSFEKYNFPTINIETLTPWFL